MNYERIYLTGFMGSGKSTIGGLVAQKMGYTFIDLDDNIESVVGIPIPEIFSKLGEIGFRDIEQHALRATAAQTKIVVATGGGAITSNNAVMFVLGHGTGVFLDVSEDELVKRLGKSQHRPLLYGREDLSEYVRETLAERRVFYESMPIRLKTEGLTSIEAATKLLSTIAS